MKTVFISSFHPAISRNILSTDVLSILAARGDIRVVIFAPAYKEGYFREKFGGPNVIVEGVDFGPPSEHFPTLVMKRLARLAIDTHTSRIEKYMKWRREGKFWYFAAASAFGWVMSRFYSLRKMLRFFDYHLANRNRYQRYFEKYRPQAVLVSDVQNERDVELAHNARGAGVAVLAMVRSWDNLTSHGVIRFFPHLLLVQNEMVRRQAVAIHDMDPARVNVVGIAHYDRYLAGPHLTRQEFFRKMGLDPSRRTILSAVVGDRYIPKNDTDPYILKILSALGVQVIVRFHPTVAVKALDGAKPYPNMVFDRPGVSFRPGIHSDREMNTEDDERLIHELYYCDLLVSGPSTICLDAAFFNKPMIFVDFYPKPLRYWEGIVLYGYDNLRAAIGSGGVRMAKTKEEFLQYIKMYLDNPRTDEEGRARFRKLCGPGDGKAGKRIAEAIISVLERYS